MAVSRRQARECAVKLLYGYEFSREAEAGDFFDLGCSEYEMISDEFAKKLFIAAVTHLDDIDRLISENASGWKINRISKMTLAILRLCICEMKYFDDIPLPVSMNEAIELAKEFDDDSSHAFINGIINSVSEKLQ